MDVNETYMAVALPAPPLAESADVLALDIASTILGDGRSSRLYRTLKEERRVVNAINAGFAPHRHPGIFYVGASLDREKSAAARDGILEVLRGLASAPPSPAELAKAKRILRNDMRYGTETNTGQSGTIGYYHTLTGSGDFLEHYIERLEAVTVEEVAGVVTKYLLGRARHGDGGAFPFCRHGGGAVTGDNSGAAAPVIETLSNGMRALLLPGDANDIVAMTCFAPLPGAVEGEADAGIVGFTLRMLMRGTISRTAAELAEAIESLGSSIDCGASDDFSAAHMICTADSFAPTAQLFAELLQAPSFEPEEIEKETQSTLAAIRRSEDDKFGLTMKRFLRELYGSHPYGIPRLGTEQSVSEFRRDQVAHLFGESLDPAGFLAVCVGNFDPEEARALLVGAFAPRAQAADALVVPPLHFPEPATAASRATASRRFSSWATPPARSPRRITRRFACSTAWSARA